MLRSSPWAVERRDRSGAGRQRAHGEDPRRPHPLEARPSRPGPSGRPRVRVWARRAGRAVISVTGSDPHGLREAIGRLEASARALDPRPTSATSSGAQVGEHVPRQSRRARAEPCLRRGRRARSGPVRDRQSPAPVSDALGTMEGRRAHGHQPASGGQFAFIPGGVLFSAALGDLLADVSNCYSGVRFGAPAAALMERSLVRWMAGLLGYPETAGGDLRPARASRISRESPRRATRCAGSPPPTSREAFVYLTRQTHHCVDEALRISAWAKPSSAASRWTTAAARARRLLEDAVKSDRAAGLRPWLVVATAGTTDTGAVDPLADIADIADAHGYGSRWTQPTAASSSPHRARKRALAGIERSRSATMDPHKGLFPFGSGALLVRDESRLAEATGTAPRTCGTRARPGVSLRRSVRRAEPAVSRAPPWLPLSSSASRPSALRSRRSFCWPARPPSLRDARLGRRPGAGSLDRDLPSCRAGAMRTSSTAGSSRPRSGRSGASSRPRRSTVRTRFGWRSSTTAATSTRSTGSSRTLAREPARLESAS